MVIAGAAAERGIQVAFELRGGTLTDTPASARRLYDMLDHPNIRALWQPLPSLDRAAHDESLEVVLPRLAHVHVFHWRPGPNANFCRKCVGPVEPATIGAGSFSGLGGREGWESWVKRS